MSTNTNEQVSSRPVFTGYDGQTYTVDDRVELHPGCDLWMRGARYGTVTGSSLTPKDRVHARLDMLPGREFCASEDTFRAVNTNAQTKVTR